MGVEAPRFNNLGVCVKPGRGNKFIVVTWVTYHIKLLHLEDVNGSWVSLGVKAGKFWA